LWFYAFRPYDVIGEYTIPAGVTITMLIFNIHQDPVHFPNPEKFDPDNFLPERIAKRHPYAYITFSAGPRNCICRKFALPEEKTALFYILSYYRLESLDKREDIALNGELVLRPENGL
jgi:cytochrome P450